MIATLNEVLARMRRASSTSLAFSAARRVGVPVKASARGGRPGPAERARARADEDELLVLLRRLRDPRVEFLPALGEARHLGDDLFARHALDLGGAEAEHGRERRVGDEDLALRAEED